LLLFYLNKETVLALGLLALIAKKNVLMAVRGFQKKMTNVTNYCLSIKQSQFFNYKTQTQGKLN
jgi:hypothetical protein